MPKSDEDLKRDLEQMQQKLSSLESKNKDLNSVIEELSKKPEEPDIGSQMAGLDQGMKGMSGGIGLSKEEVSQQIADLFKERVESKLAGVIKGGKTLEKINTLEEKINSLTEKMSAPVLKAPADFEREQRSASNKVSLGLSSFGEEVDFQDELLQIKKAVDDLARFITDLNKKAEYRLSNLEEKSKILHRLPELEKLYTDVNEKLGPENVQKLRKLVFSTDELVDEIIPDLISKKFRVKIDPIVNEIKGVKYSSNTLNSRILQLKEEIRNVKKFNEDIEKLRLEKDKIYKQMQDQEERFFEGVDILKLDMRKRLDKLIDDILTTQKAVEELSRKVDEIEAPEHVKRWVEQKTGEFLKKVQDDMKELRKIEDNQRDSISNVKERLKSIESTTIELRKELDNQTLTTNKVLDLKDFVLKKSESTESQVNTIYNKVADMKERVAVNEKEIVDQQSRMDNAFQNISKIQNMPALMQEMKEKILDLTNKNIQLEKALEVQDGNINTLSKVVSRVQETPVSIEKLKHEIEKLNTEKSLMLKDMKSQDSDMENIFKEIDSLKTMPKEIEQLNRKIDRMEIERKNLQEFIRGVLEENKALEKEIRSQKSRVSLLLNELRT